MMCLRPSSHESIYYLICFCTLACVCNFLSSQNDNESLEAETLFEQPQQECSFVFDNAVSVRCSTEWKRPDVPLPVFFENRA
ncbi:hypothetical protein Tco_1354343 [Tanacetum coccineum]